MAEMLNTGLPHLIGNPLEEKTYKELNPNQIYVLGVKDPQNPLGQQLYCINKENLFQGAFLDIDIDERIFNNPLYETSYQDVLPNQFAGLPNLALIGITNYTLKWAVDYRKNPVFQENDAEGMQMVRTFDGIAFVRYGVRGQWGRWQLMNPSFPFGMINHMIVAQHQANKNYMGWLPLDGQSYTKAQYPDLYNILQGKVQTTAESFTLPDAREKYLSAKPDNAGQTAQWQTADISDTVDIVKGEFKSLFKPMIDTGKLFKVTNKDNSDTTMSYLDDNVVLDINDATAIKGDSLTSELKVDLPSKLGQGHVSDKVRPDTVWTSAAYIYAGYPQAF